MNCSNCKWWNCDVRGMNEAMTGVKHGHCLRYPPTIHDGRSIFPFTKETTFCGEWKEHEPTEL